MILIHTHTHTHIHIRIYTYIYIYIYIYDKNTDYIYLTDFNIPSEIAIYFLINQVNKISIISTIPIYKLRET